MTAHIDGSLTHIYNIKSTKSLKSINEAFLLGRSNYSTKRLCIIIYISLKSNLTNSGTNKQ